MVRLAPSLLLLLALAACDSSPADPEVDAGGGLDGAGPDVAEAIDAGPDGDPGCASPAECAAVAEQNAADRFDAVVADDAALTGFLAAVPKGGDLHNHLTGAVYAETYLDWARTDGDCINTTSFAATASCTTGTQPVPTAGSFYDQIIDAWSMRNFMAGAQTGHDHFFATFAKYGLVAGQHRDDDLADVATRAASENQVYLETMFNLGTNLGALSASLWTNPPSSLAATDLPTLYAQLLASPQFASRLASDVAAVTNATTGYRGVLGCTGPTPPAACDVKVRYVAQVSRTGANDQIFGQLVSAFEMARVTGQLVGANLSSPEDDSASINNYDLHMAMLGFLYRKYTLEGASPLQITLHAGELTAAYLPPGSTANTYHIRAAVEVAHARRIGHGLDVLSETDASGLLDELAAEDVLVEICLSSNQQILEVSGAAHPLAQYLAHGVPVALATDDQGVSRSSMAGEYKRAVRDQHLGYRQLKLMARQSLEHAFLPGASLWTSVTTATPTPACAPTATMAIGDPPDADCQIFLDANERAATQWELERRFLAFESVQ